MLNQELIGLMNSGQAIAFVGSGVSCDAGLPSWSRLYQLVRDSLSSQGAVVEAAEVAANNGDLLGAFQYLRDAEPTQGTVDAAVTEHMGKIVAPGRYHRILADWPFRFYVTTNYDVLLDVALRAHGGWVSVGNSASENQKVGSGAHTIVWHPHGAVGLEAQKMIRLVVSKNDYLETYPDSPIANTLKAIAQTQRLVFFGFGFADEDLLALLKIVSRHTPVERPAFAILGQQKSGSSGQRQRDRYRADYNVEVIPYFSDGGDHSDLRRTIEAYSPFVLRRSTNFNEPISEPPSYDPVVTSLHTHLRLGSSASDLGDEAVRALSRSWVLGRIGTAGSDKTLNPTQLSEIGLCTQDIERAVDSLTGDGLVHMSQDGLALTSAGEEVMSKASGDATLGADRFAASLRGRVEAIEATDIKATRVVAIVRGFFEKLSRERGLGLAQNLCAHEEKDRAYRATALIQDLPTRLSRCANRSEAFAVIRVVSEILTLPRQEESAYLGYLTQAYFGQQILRATDHVRKVDRDHLSRTCFIADSSVLVPALSKGAEGHDLARRLVEGLRSLGCGLVTTDMLLDETWQHAHWAAALVQREGEDSAALLDAARGARGYRQNLFVEGFVRAPNLPTGATFRDYLRSIFSKLSGLNLRPGHVSDALAEIGVEVVGLEGWDGFESIAYPQVDGLEEQIRDRRKRAGTFRWPHQTRAEAQAVLIVTRLREKTFRLRGREFGDAFFLSHTRIVEGLDGYPQRIMLRPEGLAEWLLTSEPFGEREAAALFNILLWELGVSGVKFVSDELVQRRFSGMVTASKATLLRTAAARRDVLIERYGPNPEDAFKAIHALETPFLLRSVVDVALDKLQEGKEKAERRATAAEAEAGLKESERQEFIRLKTKQATKRAKGRRKAKAAKRRKKGTGKAKRKGPSKTK